MAAKKNTVKNTAKNTKQARPAPVEEPQQEDALEEELDLDGQIESVFGESDERIQEGYQNTEQRGERFAPPDGTYTMTLTDDESGACGQVRLISPKDENDETPPYPLVALSMTIDAAPDPDLVGTLFDIPIFLKPYEDKRTGTTKTAGSGTIKAICEMAFGSEIDDLKVAAKKILAEAGNTTWKVKVKRKDDPKRKIAKDDALPNYTFLEMVQS